LDGLRDLDAVDRRFRQFKNTDFFETCEHVYVHFAGEWVAS
jgi:hypothetical protein